MNAVLNKKFGTSETYAPETWPDEVNLLGALEEKTVSGSVVAFADGADDVPLKSCAVTIAPTLTGVSSVGVVHSGMGSGFTQGSLNDNTGAEASASTRIRTGFIKYSGETSLYFVGKGVESDDKIRRIYWYSTNNVSGFLSSNTLDSMAREIPYLYENFTAPTGATYFRIVMQKTTPTDNITPDGKYIEINPTTHTATLGRTIYGGSVDVVNGQGTDGYIKYVIDGVNVYGYLTGANNMNIMPYGLNIDGTISKWLCDTLTANSTNFGYNSNQGFIFIRQAGWSSIPNVTDEATFNAYCQENPITLILPLATAETFTFDPVPIDSKLGNNTLWAEQGSGAEVTYRGQGTVYQYPEGEGVSF